MGQGGERRLAPRSARRVPVSRAEPEAQRHPVVEALERVRPRAESAAQRAPWTARGSRRTLAEAGIEGAGAAGPRSVHSEAQRRGTAPAKAGDPQDWPDHRRPVRRARADGCGGHAHDQPGHRRSRRSRYRRHLVSVTNASTMLGRTLHPSRVWSCLRLLPTEHLSHPPIQPPSGRTAPSTAALLVCCATITSCRLHLRVHDGYGGGIEGNVRPDGRRQPACRHPKPREAQPCCHPGRELQQLEVSGPEER